MSIRRFAPVILVLSVLTLAVGLGAWKYTSLEATNAGAAASYEPAETVTAAVATPREHRQTTSVIGTVLALQSVTLQNELPGTVRYVGLKPGTIVDAGTVLVALDVSVEEAELAALEAEAALARTTLARLERLRAEDATSQLEVDQARAAYDVALAQIARTKAIIERKTIRAPFTARVGLADLHPGQYLDAGTTLTTLQSVSDAQHVDFIVPQEVASTLRPGDVVDVFVDGSATPHEARIVALDARVDPDTRSAVARARLTGTADTLAPGAAVRVSVGTGASRTAVSVPGSALRQGPEGDFVFVLAEDAEGRLRAARRPVTTGGTFGDEVLVLDGLAPGERVAASGAFKLQDRMAVLIVENPVRQASAETALSSR